MQEQDYDASVLFGIANFYHRVGFATCFPEHGVAIDTREAERVQTSLREFGYTDGRISSARHPSCVPGAGMGFPWGPVLASPLTRQTGEGAPRRDRTGTTTGGSPKTGRKARSVELDLVA